MIKKIFYVMVIVLAIGCKKETKQEKDHPVPYVPVNITIYPNDPFNFKIQAIGGWMYIEGGINGIIIYRKSQEEFVALERTSSHLPDNPSAKVQVESDNFTLRDTISNSKWRIFDGTITQGPATWSLRLYGTSYASGALRISN
jgi:hypothetical protein